MYNSDVEGAQALVGKYQRLREEIAKVIVGQDEVIHNTVLSIFCQGHVLLVGVPGLAKTLLVNTIGQALGLSFSRIQFELSRVRFLKKYNQKPVSFFLIKLLITLIWLNPFLIKATRKYIKDLWRI